MRRDLEIKGKTLKGVLKDSREEVIYFVTDINEVYKMEHFQECCENVEIEDINGDLNGLVGSPILIAEEYSSPDKMLESFELKDKDDLEEYTFYRFATKKGYVDIRWFSYSNGYYSVGVDFYKSPILYPKEKELLKDILYDE